MTGWIIPDHNDAKYYNYERISILSNEPEDSIVCSQKNETSLVLIEIIHM